MAGESVDVVDEAQVQELLSNKLVDVHVHLSVYPKDRDRYLHLRDDDSTLLCLHRVHAEMGAWRNTITLSNLAR